MSADCSAAATLLVGYRQTGRAVLMQFIARALKRFVHPAGGGRRPHDLLHANGGGLLVVSRYSAAHIAFRDYAYQLKIFPVLYHWRASAT